MTFHESTVKKLRWALSGHQDHLEEAERAVEKRRQALADAQEELGYAENRAAVLRANVADCQSWLDFAALCDTNEELAHAFANAVLNRDVEMAEAKQHWGSGHDTANCTECIAERENATSPTAADMRAIFGEPVEGRDYTLIDAQPIVPRSLAEIEAEEAAEDAPSCARCAIPFDPDDKAFDGNAEYHATGFCRGCIDSCHEGGATHRCIICAPRDAESGADR